MVEILKKLSNAVDQFNKLDHKIQFAIVGGFLLFVILSKKLRQRRKIQTADHKRMRDMAALLLNPNKQKRDGIYWFYQFFLVLFIVSLITILISYVLLSHEIRPFMIAISALKLSKSKCLIYMVGISFFFAIMALLFKKLSSYYHSKLVVVKPQLSDAQVQEMQDKSKTSESNHMDSPSSQVYPPPSPPSKSKHVKSD